MLNLEVMPTCEKVNRKAWESSQVGQWFIPEARSAALKGVSSCISSTTGKNRGFHVSLKVWSKFKV